MNNHLRYYHLGCGHRLQTNFPDFKCELRDRFYEMNKKIRLKLNEKTNRRSIADETE